MRKKIISLFTVLAFGAISIFAQELAVSPAHVVCDYELSDKIDNQIKSKLQRALAKYGISSEPGMSRFAMVPRITINNEQTRPTVPPLCDVEFDFVVTLSDNRSGKDFATYTYSDIKCTGGNKSNAISKGVSTLKLNDPDFIRFVEESKSKVISHYESQIPAIVAKAKNAANGRNFQEAIYYLYEIPTECPSYNSKVGPLVQQYYKKEMDLKGEKVLADAKAAWAANPTEEGAAEVASILADMPPSCSSSAAAKSFISTISSKVEAIHKWERDYQDREQKYAHNEKLATIEAAKAIGVAYAKSQPKVVYKTYYRIW
jgi:hypothetical protein